MFALLGKSLKTSLQNIVHVNRKQTLKIPKMMMKYATKNGRSAVNLLNESMPLKRNRSCSINTRILSTFIADNRRRRKNVVLVKKKKKSNRKLKTKKETRI